MGGRPARPRAARRLHRREPEHPPDDGHWPGGGRRRGELRRGRRGRHRRGRRRRGHCAPWASPQGPGLAGPPFQGGGSPVVLLKNGRLFTASEWATHSQASVLIDGERIAWV